MTANNYDSIVNIVNILFGKGVCQNSHPQTSKMIFLLSLFAVVLSQSQPKAPPVKPPDKELVTAQDFFDWFDFEPQECFGPPPNCGGFKSVQACQNKCCRIRLMQYARPVTMQDFVSD